MKSLLNTLFVLAGVSGASLTMALEPIKTNVLIDWCSSEITLESNCKAYLQGYIAGAYAASRLVERSADSETFQERATRARIGQKLPLNYNIVVNYCIPATVTLNELVNLLVREYNNRKEPPKIAYEFTERVLSKHYGCD